MINIIRQIADKRKVEIIINNLLIKNIKVLDGGKGSGFFGHKGRPGMIGGSSSTGGNKVLKEELDSRLILDMRKDKRLIDKYGNMSKFLGSISLTTTDTVKRINRVIANGKGVFASREERDKADELLLQLENEGLIDTKEYKDLKRRLLQDDYLCDLYELLEEKYGLPETDYIDKEGAEEGKKEGNEEEDKKEKPEKTIEEANKDINKPIDEAEISISFNEEGLADTNLGLSISNTYLNLFKDDIGNFNPIRKVEVEEEEDGVTIFDMTLDDDSVSGRLEVIGEKTPSERQEYYDELINDIKSGIKEKGDTGVIDDFTYIKLQYLGILKAFEEVDSMKTEKFRIGLENFINNLNISEGAKRTVGDYLFSSYINDLNNIDTFNEIALKLYQNRKNENFQSTLNMSDEDIFKDLNKGDFSSYLNRVNGISEKLKDMKNIANSREEKIKATYYEDSSSELYNEILKGIKDETGFYDEEGYIKKVNLTEEEIDELYGNLSNSGIYTYIANKYGLSDDKIDKDFIVKGMKEVLNGRRALRENRDIEDDKIKLDETSYKLHNNYIDKKLKDLYQGKELSEDEYTTLSRDLVYNYLMEKENNKIDNLTPIGMTISSGANSNEIVLNRRDNISDSELNNIKSILDDNLFIQTFLNEHEFDKSGIDFNKSLTEALKDLTVKGREKNIFKKGELSKDGNILWDRSKDYWNTINEALDEGNINRALALGIINYYDAYLKDLSDDYKNILKPIQSNSEYIGTFAKQENLTDEELDNRYKSLINSSFKDYIDKKYGMDAYDITEEEFKLGLSSFLSGTTYSEGGTKIDDKCIPLKPKEYEANKATIEESIDNMDYGDELTTNEARRLCYGLIYNYMCDTYQGKTNGNMKEFSNFMTEIENPYANESNNKFSYKAYDLKHNKYYSDKVYNSSKSFLDNDINSSVKRILDYDKSDIFNKDLNKELSKYEGISSDKLKEEAQKNYKEAIDKINGISLTSKEGADEIRNIKKEYEPYYRQAVISKAISNEGSKALRGTDIKYNYKTKSGRTVSDYKSVIDKPDIDTNIVSSRAVNDIDTNYDSDKSKAAERVKKIIPTLKAENLYNDVDKKNIENYEVSNHGKLSPKYNSDWDHIIYKGETKLGTYIEGMDKRNDLSFLIHKIANSETDINREELEKKLEGYRIDSPNKLTDEEATLLFHLMTNGGQSYDSIKTSNVKGIGSFVRIVAASAPRFDGDVYRAENAKNLDRDWANIKVGDSLSVDGMHFTYSKTFFEKGFKTKNGRVPSALSMFGEEEPMAIKIVGGVPFFNLEPYARKTKMHEHEGIIAGFLKVKAINKRTIKSKNGREKTYKEYEMEYDWDRLKEYLKLNAKVFANKYGLYNK